MAKTTKLPALGGEQNENPEKSFSSKKMLKQHAEKGTKMRYADRMTVEITSSTQFYRVGQVITPSKIKGQALIDQGIAKKYVEKED